MSQPYHPPLFIEGKNRDFSHLEPFHIDIDSVKAGKILHIHVRFTSHCFTKQYDVATHPTDEPILLDAGGYPRSFCPTRHDLSLRIPSLIRALNHPKATVRQTTEERNWLHSVTVHEPDGKYHVFFELRRAPLAARHLQDLNLVVESAYPRNAIRQEPRTRGSMNFILLCGKVHKGEPFTTRR